jgi:hypothetical protein
MNCWICGAPGAETREHRTKASDLRALFGKPTPQNPIYFHAYGGLDVRPRRNVRVGSVKSDALKYNHRICQRCNSAATQPYDFAWEYASAELREAVPRLLDRGSFRANWLFPYDTGSGMRDLHLYFVKLFGCQIAEGNIPVDQQSFSRAILERKPHPNLFIAFGHLAKLPVIAAGGSEVHAEVDIGGLAFAAWIYHVGDLAVRVMYARTGEHRQGLDGAWHPNGGSRRIPFTEF